MKPTIYVTGHRNPDTDSIAAAIGYAELLGKLDDGSSYVPVRLGDVNAQTRWVLDRAGVAPPRLLPHILVRVRDVMQEDLHAATVDDSVREVGLMMTQLGISVVPVLHHDGRLAGVVTERALARRYIRESREASNLVDTPTRASAIAAALGGEILAGEDRPVAGRVWVFAAETTDSNISEGDVVVVANREDAQRFAIELGVAVLVLSNGASPAPEVLAMAAARGTVVVSSPLDSYVSGRMVTLAAPCRAVMDSNPLTVRPEDVLTDVTDNVKDVHYRAAVAVDGDRKPVGIITRSDLVSPKRRRVVLVDHAEAAQSVPGIEHAEVVEILDHHHIGSIETHVPVRATFDPVGSTSTLVAERYEHERVPCSKASATLLLGAILSDTVILNSPTTTRRDRSAAAHLGSRLGVDPEEFGREMFEAGSDMSEATAEQIVSRDAKDYEVTSGSVSIAQIETVGRTLDGRLEELSRELRRQHDRHGHVLSALMVTDILAGSTQLLVAGDVAAVERALGVTAEDGKLDLPGVMSRKKEIAPRLLGAF